MTAITESTQITDKTEENKFDDEQKNSEDFDFLDLYY